ncbi:MAG: ATP-binding protein [Sutterellaceae bacterium]|nr:ATP-binding protein [Sutterellaceae bacterium]
MLETRVTEKDFLESRFSTGQTPELTLDDFDHIPRVKTTLLPYLKLALQQHRAGVNILLYGDPGTGKTELSRVLGQELGACTYEIATKEGSGRVGDNTRLDHWQVAGHLLKSNDRALLLLDEAEDIFSAGISFFGINMNTPLRKNKAQINRLLETNACPTIWMTNSLHTMDPAMIRRFDILLEVAQPTKSQRRKIVDKLAGTTLSPDLCERLSRAKDLSPAIISRALKVLDTVEPTAGMTRDNLMVNLVNETLRAQGKDLVQTASNSVQKVYSLDYVNADADLEQLIEGIGRRPQARLCLYGVPGTGKSAYAAWLAEKLNKPLVVKRASDLLDCYVGMTEQNIAAAFREAKAEGAVLLIDEADSFLQDRTKSMHSWETTQVNEMLTQIETFDGIFIATTNLVDTLDPASIRRFDIKVKFDAMTENQAQALFESYTEQFGIRDSVTPAVLRQARELSFVTPGDFAAVARQAGFHPITDAEDFVGRLQTECSLKKENKHRPIGFG